MRWMNFVSYLKKMRDTCKTCRILCLSVIDHMLEHAKMGK